MPKRIVKSPVQVVRGGKFVLPPVGQVFDFTTDEVATFRKLNPSALAHIVVEDTPEPTTSDLPVISQDGAV